MSWTRGRRELGFQRPLAARAGRGVRAGHLEHRQDRSARLTSRPASSWTGSSRPRTRWSHSPGSTATLWTAARRRSLTTLIVHIGDEGPPLLEGAGPLSPETAQRLACDARRLTIKRSGRDLVHSRVGRCASYAQQRALHKRSSHCQYPACCGATRELEAHHVISVERGGKTELDNLILLCPRHHKLLHDHSIRAGGNCRAACVRRRGLDGRSPPTNHTHHPTDAGGLPDRAIPARRREDGPDLREDPRALGDETAPREANRRSKAVPLIQVKLIENVFSPAQKTRDVIQRLTDTMVEIEGENMRPVTWVTIDEVSSGEWGIAGNAVTSEDLARDPGRSPGLGAAGLDSPAPLARRGGTSAPSLPVRRASQRSTA